MLSSASRTRHLRYLLPSMRHRAIPLIATTAAAPAWSRRRISSRAADTPSGATWEGRLAAVDTAATVVAADHGLLMLFSPYCELRTGTIVNVGSGEHASKACVLFVQHGHYFATLLNGDAVFVAGGEVVASCVGQTCEATNEVLCIDLPSRGPAALVGHTIDCFAKVMGDVSTTYFEPPSTTGVPLFAGQPSGSDRGLIVDNLSTGWLAIDALTPIGRGQSMLLVGPHGSGKTTIAAGCIATASCSSEERIGDKSQIQCVFASLSRDGNSVSELENLGLDSKATIVAPIKRSGCATEAVQKDENGAPMVWSVPPLVEPYMMANAAVAVGEYWRDSGADSLVIIDEMNSFHELWCTASKLAQAHDPKLRFENGKHEIMELRPFYSHLLQRSAKLGPREGGAPGGSLSILALVGADSSPSPSPSPSSSSAGPSTDQSDLSDLEGNSTTYTLSDFSAENGCSEKDLARLEKLAAYGVAITPQVLEKMGLEPPGSIEAHPALTTATGWVGRQLQHTEEMMSLADGHIHLDSEKFAQGQRPALNHLASLTRIRDTRPPALQDVAMELRFRMAAFGNLSTEAAEEALLTNRQARAQLAAWHAALTQDAGSQPVALEHAVVLLFAVNEGYFSTGDGNDANLLPAIRGGADAPLIRFVETTAPELLLRIRETGELSVEEATSLHAQVKGFLVWLRL